MEDGFWLGLLGPSGYLQSKTLREIRGLRADLASADRAPIRDGASNQWDALELEVQAAVARLHAPDLEYAELLGLNSDDETRERVEAELQAKVREAAAAELPFFRAMSEWANALPQVDSPMANLMIETLQDSMAGYVKFCEEWATGAEEYTWLTLPEQADTQWWIFKEMAKSLAASRRRPG
jgi:hypothetical protein